MQIKITVRYHLTPVRMTIINKSTNKCTLVGMQIGSNTVESGMEAPQNIKNGSAFQPSYPTYGNTSEESQNINSKEHKHPMFIAALFTIAKIQKQPKCLSVSR